MTMERKCACDPKQFYPPEVFNVSVSIKDKDPARVELDFGVVPFNSKRSKNIVLDFQGEFAGAFVIRVSDDQKYSPVFRITPDEGLHKETTGLKLKCTYLPRIAYHSNYEQFIFHGRQITVIISLSGETTGPILTVSTNYVKLFQTPRRRKGRAVLEIRNTTNIPAPFSIEVDSKQKLFTVTPLNAVCTDLTFVVVNFNPPEKFGAYSQHLFCMVYGGQPIDIHVLGVYSKNEIDPSRASVVYYPFPFSEKNSFKACFRDEKEENGNLVPVALNTHHLDLGRAIVKELFDDESTVSTKNFNLTNNLDEEVIVNWIETDKVFSIFPRKVTVGPGECMFFKCVFSPTYTETFFNRKFTAQIYWKPRNISCLPINENVIVVPLTVSITLQGHSFPEGQMPLSHLELVPTVVEFPDCLPRQNVYQSFKIINKISKPIMFKLVPPAISYVKMIPMAGVITDFRVILAHLRLRRVKTLTEHWNIILNGQEEKKIAFTVSGASEIPAIKIGTSNEIEFRSIQINTIASSSLLLHNISPFNVNFQFVPSENFITVEPLEGFVKKYRAHPITVKLNVTTCTPSKFKLLVRLYAQQRLHELIGPSYEHFLTVYSSSTYSELSASPLVNDFKLVEYGTIINTSFQLCNFGVSTVYFKLHIKSSYISDDYFKLDPVFGQVEPNGSLKINLTIECKTLGDNPVEIDYFSRSSADSEDHEKEAVALMRFSYKCEISILRISEIVEHTYGNLFSKRNFWKFLKINELNELLYHLRPDQTESLELNLPECPVGSRHYITLLIENNTDLDTEIQLKRIKLCDCGYKQKASAYRVGYELDCVHRDSLFMEISEAKVDRKSSQKITINVSYCLAGETPMAYEIQIRPFRTMILRFNIFGIPENRSRVSVYHNSFSMKMRCGILHARKPTTQIFWFYNNSRIGAKIDIDLGEVRKLNEEKKYNIFECVYKDTHISPGGIWPLMIKFSPSEFKRYQVEVYIRMNEEIKVLTIEGYDSIKPRTGDYFECFMPEECTATHKFPLKLSKDSIMIKCLPTWNSTERFIIIENLTRSKLIYYEWADIHIDGLVRITAIQKTGILRPGKSRSVTIRVESFDENVVANFTLPCVAMDLQLLYAHKKKQAIQEQIKEIQEDEFEFSDHPIKLQKHPDGYSDMRIHNKQLNYEVALTIGLNIVDRRDLLIYVEDPKEILTFNSPETITVDSVYGIKGSKSDFSNDSNKKCSKDSYHEPKCQNLEATIVGNILENVLSEVIFQDSFPQIISNIFEDVPLYYSQLNLDDRALKEKCEPLEDGALQEIRRNEIKKFFSKPTVPVLSETFKSVIEDSIHEVFNLTSLSDQLEDERAIKSTMDHLTEICTLKECLCPSQKI